MKTVSLILCSIALFLLPFCSALQFRGQISANAALSNNINVSGSYGKAWQVQRQIPATSSKTKNISSNIAYARVISVKPNIDNEWIVAKMDPSSPTRWAVDVKKYLKADIFKTYFLVYMYARSNPTEDLKEFHRGPICALLDPNESFYPNNFMPRQIIEIILPGRYGSCNIENTTKPIAVGGLVNTNPKDNWGVQFPKSKPFQLVVNILTQRYINKGTTHYFFQVNMTVASLRKVER